jgi:O-6-methylguanine DNA methyltransferase
MNNFTIIRTPIGFLDIHTNSNAVCKIRFSQPNDISLPRTPQIEYSTIMRQTILELHEYFYEKRRTFDVRINISCSSFSAKVISKLREIPFGSTVSYKDIAIKLENSNASRAVGRINKYNPIAIIIPCHRVISSKGSLGGYNAGLEKKIYLLRHEGADINFKK